MTFYEYPELIARFYDVTYKQIRDAADHDFYLDKIQKAKGPVLEVGAGTGRFFKDALEAGSDIWAIEPSKFMLARLKDRINKAEHHRVIQTTVEEMDLERKFALIIAPFRVFGHILSQYDQLRALENIHKHLEDDGLFVFDLFVPDPGMIASGLEGEMDFDGYWKEGFRLRRTVSMFSDIVTQVSHVEMRFDWEEEDGWHSDAMSFDIRYYFRYELELLLEKSPFSEARIYGDFNESPLRKDSKEFVITCRK